MGIPAPPGTGSPPTPDETHGPDPLLCAVRTGALLLALAILPLTALPLLRGVSGGNLMSAVAASMPTTSLALAASALVVLSSRLLDVHPRPGLPRPEPFIAGAVLATAILPALCAVGLGEAGSALWTRAYALLLPGSAIYGAHLPFVAASAGVGGRAAAPMKWLGPVALAGSIGAPFATAAAFYPRVAEAGAVPGIALCILALAADLAVFVMASRVLRGGVRAASPPTPT